MGPRRFSCIHLTHFTVWLIRRWHHSVRNNFISLNFPRYMYNVNTLRPRQNGHHFPDDILKCLFFNENVWISIRISLKFIPNGPINNNPALVQIMAWRRRGDKPLSETVMVSLLTHICVARPQWVNSHKTYLELVALQWPNKREISGSFHHQRYILAEVMAWISNYNCGLLYDEITDLCWTSKTVYLKGVDIDACVNNFIPWF